MKLGNVLLSEVRDAMLDGGRVEFHWNVCQPYLVYPAGDRIRLDGRSYQGFLQTMADKFHEMKFGSIEKGDLVITWKHSKIEATTRDYQAKQPHLFDSTGADESNEPLICALCGLDIKNKIHTLGGRP